MRVGFIGVGAMGGPMARHVAQGGFLQAVWNRTEEKSLALARDLNVTCAPSPAALASQVDVVLLCVSADRDVLEVIHSLLPEIRQSSIVIDFSTVSSVTARQAAELLRARGAEFLDSPVTGGVEGAHNGTLVMMVGGQLSVLEKVLPILQTMSRRIVYMGDVGAGQATKAVNQVMAAGINQAVTEALAFGEKLGLDMQKAIDVISGGAAGNWFLEKRGSTMLEGIFSPGFKVALHHKDLKICREMAKHLGMALPLVEMTVEDYEKLIAGGFGNEDISALYRIKKDP